MRKSLATTGDAEAAVAAFRSRTGPHFFFSRAETPRLVDALETSLPGWSARTLAYADRITEGAVRLLSEDEVDLRAYASMPWQQDVLNDFRWDAKTFYRRVPVPYDRADMKVPWELARCQHFTTLGFAYRVSRDERYARALVAQIDDFIAHNPVGYGINWVSTMDVAIRAANWLWGYELVADAESVTDAFVTRLLASFVAHGRHIEENISVYEGGITTNHTVADYAGLVYLGVMLPELHQSEHWTETGIAGLCECMRTHTSEDGVDYENSLSYHRLVTEMYLGALVLAEGNGRVFPPEYRSRLERMIEFVMYYTTPDGRAPLVGDSDDGRWHVLGDYFGWEPSDHRSLLRAGGFVFARPDFTQAGGESDLAIEEAAWLAGVAALADVPPSHGPPTLESRGFPAGGRYVLRHGNHHALVCADDVGTRGFGNHKHNDFLSYELTVNGRATVVDCGSYLYLRDREARTAFRSTRSHNTLLVDGAEQNEMPDPFRMDPRARVTVREWRTGEHADVFDASHTGYVTLPSSVRHRRRVVFGKEPFAWLVVDSLEGEGEHAVESYVHLSPDLTVTAATQPLARQSQLDATVARLADELTLDRPPALRHGAALSCAGSDGGVLVVPFDWGLVSVDTGWVAPRYGRRVQAPVIRLHGALSAGTLIGYLIVAA